MTEWERFGTNTGQRLELNGRDGYLREGTRIGIRSRKGGKETDYGTDRAGPELVNKYEVVISGPEVWAGNLRCASPVGASG